MGLNPYSLYEDCYGGVPDSRGVIRETQTEIEVMVPELALRMDNERLVEFEQVSHQRWSRVDHVSSRSRSNKSIKLAINADQVLIWNKKKQRE